MNAHTWVSLSIWASIAPGHVHAHAWPTWIDGSVCVNALVCVLVCVFRSPLLHGFLCSLLFFCFAVFESFAILLRFYCSMFSLFVCLSVCVFFCFKLCSLFAFLYLVSAFTSCFYFSAGKFCCTRAMLFYCFLPQGHWFFFTLILLFFVNVHYLEDCTLRVCLQSAPLNSGFAIGSIRVLFKDLLFDSLRSSPSPPARGEGFSFFFTSE